MSIEKLLSLYLKERPRVTVDSRTVQPGDWFFALPGQKTDGHLYVEDVLKNGAGLAVVERGEGFKVENTLTALQELARLVQKQRKSKVIAVTGSVGKTTTREFLSEMLSTQFKVGKNSHNQNSQIGLALTLLNEVKGDEDFLVLEMAMTHKGQIKRLTEMAPPYVALITKVEPVHMVNFESIEGIAEAKAEVFSHPETLFAVLNPSIMHFSAMKSGKCQKIPFKDHFPLPKLPSHHIENYRGACTVFELLGGDLKNIPLEFKSFEKRFQKSVKKGITFVNDSYNASEVAVIGALENLPQGKKRIAVLGELRELGKIAEETHQRIARKALDHVDELILVGNGALPMQKVWEEKREKPLLFQDYKGALEELRKRVHEGDVVLIKGANGLGLWRLYEEF